MPRRISPRRLWRHRIVQGATKMSRPENPVLLKKLWKGDPTMKLRVSTQELGLLAIDARQLVDDYPFLFFLLLLSFFLCESSSFVEWTLIFCWLTLNVVWQNLFLSLIWSNFPRFPDQTQSRYARRFQSTLQAVNYGGQIQSTVPLLGWFLGGRGVPTGMVPSRGNPHPPRIFFGMFKKNNGDGIIFRWCNIPDDTGCAMGSVLPWCDFPPPVACDFSVLTLCHGVVVTFPRLMWHKYGARSYRKWALYRWNKQAGTYDHHIQLVGRDHNWPGNPQNLHETSSLAGLWPGHHRTLGTPHGDCPRLDSWWGGSIGLEARRILWGQGYVSNTNWDRESMRYNRQEFFSSAGKILQELLYQRLMVGEIPLDRNSQRAPL